MEGKEDETRQAFVLLAAWGPSPDPAYNEGVVLIADRNSYPGVKNGSDYLAKTAREHFEPQGFKEVSPIHEVTLGEHQFFQVDYVKQDVCQTFVSTVWRDYVLVFNLAAPTTQEMSRLTDSLKSLKFVVHKPANTGTQTPASK